mgnify:CR=1 FL=1
MNVVVLIGRLTRDPEIRYTDSQTAIVNFSLAIDRGKDKNGESRRTDFPRITVFGKLAENCNRYLAKGRMVAIQGRIQTSSYQNKNGDTVYTTDVIADRVQFLPNGKKDGDGQTAASASNNQGYDPYQPKGTQQMHMNQMNQENQMPAGFEAINDDDVPF